MDTLDEKDPVVDVADEMTLAEAQQVDAPVVEEEQKEDAPVDLKYQVGTWHGYPNLKCPHCNYHAVVAGFDTDGSRAVRDMDTHIEATHPGAWLEGV